MPNVAVTLCGLDAGCRRIQGHAGKHSRFPNEAWSFFAAKDKNKIGKAGFATPRGGAKGAYQNHVLRSSKVIVPYERLGSVNLAGYEAGYVVRLLPEQYFSAANQEREAFTAPDAPVVGVDAFVLYRTYESWESLPPPPEWEIRGLVKNGQVVANRGAGVVDTGHYVLRLPTAGAGKPERTEGPPQGIFAPEYASTETNFLSQCVLAWMIVHAFGSPYTTTQARHIEAILASAGLAAAEPYELRGSLRHGLAACPLCLRIIRYEQLHSLVNFEEGAGLVNAAIQIEGATRSTDVNLFHLTPLVYGELEHGPAQVAWGHANCNTRLGQRRCYSISDLVAMDLKIGIVLEDKIETIGWISTDFQMIRSPDGAVWIQLCDDMSEAEKQGAVMPAQPLDAEDAELPVAVDDLDEATAE